MEPRLGQTLRDVVTGFTGIASIRVEMLNGNVQFSLYPQTADSAKYPEGMSVDANLCEVVDDRLVHKVVEPDKDLPFIPLGKPVRDVLTGFVGTPIRRNIYLSGCVYYSVEGRTTAPGATAFAEEYHLSAQRLERVPESSPNVPQSRPTGGPSTPIPRRT